MPEPHSKAAASAASAPVNGHGIPNRELVGLGAYYFLFYGAVAFSMAYVPILLKARGLSLSEIAVLAAILAAAGGVSQAKLGHLSDAVGSRKVPTIACCLSCAVSYLFYSWAHSFWAFVPLFAWTGVTYLGGHTLPQAIVSDWTSAAGSTARGFSAARIWGTIGFIVALLLVDRWPALADGHTFLYWVACLFAASVLPILVVREAPIRKTEHGMLKGAAKVLLSQRAYVFVLCYTVFRLCESGFLNYLGLYIKDMGGGNQAVAQAYWIAAAAEIPLVLLAGTVSDRIGRKAPLVLAFAVWPVRLYLYSLITTPDLVCYVQLLHGFTYGITLVVSVAYMADISPRDLRGTAQGLLSVSNAVAMGAGPLLMGIVGDALGLAAAFRVMAVITVAALIVLVAFVKEPSKDGANDE